MDAGQWFVHVFFVNERWLWVTRAGWILAIMAVLSARAAGVADSPRVVEIRSWLAAPRGERNVDDPAMKMPLSRDEAEKVSSLFAADRKERLAAERGREVEEKTLVMDGKPLRWLEKSFGEAPAGGRSLWISLHGGGAAPQVVNDQQWLNQLHLYQPTEGIYIAPRAPTDTWNLWHEAHIDLMIQRLIEDYVVVRGVNPDKVYLLGYSAGGDGVWQLAPRMADRFAAAAMMAGHPNGATLEGLRNLPFAIFMGGNDGAYDRNKVAAERTAELDRLERADSGGYVHISRIYDGLGHWMDGRDKEALPWMAGFRRNPWPDKIVWVQDDVIHRRFYWLGLRADVVTGTGRKMIAKADGQEIRLDGEVPAGTMLYLSDALLDLDRAVSVRVNGKAVFTGVVPRTSSVIFKNMEERWDVKSVSSATWVFR
jgi:hypothetical protein